MPKEDNLRPFNEWDEKDHKAASSKGGKKSGETRRKKRAMKDAMKLLLDMPVTNENTKIALESIGIKEQDMTNQVAMLVKMMQQATKGDIKAAEFVRDTAGEKPKEQQQIEVTPTEIKVTLDE